MEGEELLNRNVADMVHPYAKWAMVSLICGRMLLILISLKYLPITKFYFFYELLVTLVNQCLPTVASVHIGN